MYMARKFNSRNNHFFYYHTHMQNYIQQCDMQHGVNNIYNTCMCLQVFSLSFNSNNRHRAHDESREAAAGQLCEAYGCWHARAAVAAQHA